MKVSKKISKNCIINATFESTKTKSGGYGYYLENNPGV